MTMEDEAMEDEVTQTRTEYRVVWFPPAAVGHRTRTFSDPTAALAFSTGDVHDQAPLIERRQVTYGLWEILP